MGPLFRSLVAHPFSESQGLPLYPCFLVDLTECPGGDLGLAELSMEEDGPLGQGPAGPLLESEGRGQVRNLLGAQLRRSPSASSNTMIFAGSLHVEHHPHALHGELGQPGDVPQLQEGPTGAGTTSGPIAQQADVLHQVLLCC